MTFFVFSVLPAPDSPLREGGEEREGERKGGREGGRKGGRKSEREGGRGRKEEGGREGKQLYIYNMYM